MHVVGSWKRARSSGTAIGVEWKEGVRDGKGVFSSRKEYA